MVTSVGYYADAATNRLKSKVPNQNQTASAYNTPRGMGVDAGEVVAPVGTVNTATASTTPLNPIGAPVAPVVQAPIVVNPAKTITNAPVGTFDSYKTQAQNKLGSNYASTLANLLSNYQNTLAGYTTQGNAANQNALAETQSNNRNTTTAQNNYSNNTLGRGMGRSTIATTGLGELDVIGNRLNAETESRKTAALNAIEAMKAAAGAGYEAQKLAATQGYNSDVDAYAQELMDKATDTFNANERFNLEQQNAAREALAKREADKAQYEANNANDLDIAHIAYDKSIDTQDLKNTGGLSVADVNNAIKKYIADLQAKTSTNNNIRTTGTSAANNKRTTATSTANNKRTTATSTANNKRTTATSKENNIRTTSTSAANNIRTTNTSASNNAARIAASKAKAAASAKAKASKGTATGKSYETSYNKVINGAYATQDKANILKNILSDVNNNAKLSKTERAALVKKINGSISALNKKQQAINVYRAGNSGS